MEQLLAGLMHGDLPNWSTALFIYLAICLTVRMAPFEGNRRGTLGAIVLAGIVIGILGSLLSAVRDALEVRVG